MKLIALADVVTRIRHNCMEQWPIGLVGWLLIVCFCRPTVTVSARESHVDFNW